MRGKNTAEEYNLCISYSNSNFCQSFLNEHTKFNDVDP